MKQMGVQLNLEDIGNIWRGNVNVAEKTFTKREKGLKKLVAHGNSAANVYHQCVQEAVYRGKAL